MAKQLLFYESVIPVSQNRHADLSIEPTGYQFAAQVNSVPLTAVELPHAAREYTIVFAGSGDNITPVVILGVEDNKNLYVAEKGKWNADYVPAFVRRYPFVFSRSEDGNKFMLCVDEDWSGCNREGRGKRLFDEKGERTEYLTNMLGFLERYQQHFQRTQAYCKKLSELQLLENMQAEFTMPNGTKRSLGGFLVVNREKLKNLESDKLAELTKTDELELTYYHLLSMNNFGLMIRKAISAPPEPPADGTAPASAGEDTASAQAESEEREPQPAEAKDN